MKNIKVGNIEYKVEKEEIILWYPNDYYKSQKRLRRDGYKMNSDGSMTKDGVITIHPSLFKDKMHCLTIAFINWDHEHDEFDVKSVGTRAFELNEDNEKTFKEILNKIKKQNKGNKHV